MNSHVDVASHNNRRYVASTNTYIANDLHHTYHNSRYYCQEPISTMNSLSFDATGNIQHAYPYSSAAELAIFGSTTKCVDE
jgi:hypothetical protein